MVSVRDDNGGRAEYALRCAARPPQARSSLTLGKAKNRLTMNTAIIEVPHADDEVFGCGGAISVLSTDRWNIIIRIWTDAGGKLRASQLRRALVALGAASAKIVRVSGIKDTELDKVPRSEAVRVCTDLYGRSRPRMVFCPFYEDSHQDHRALARIVQSGLRRFNSVDVFMFEVPSSTESAFTPFIPNYFIPISGEQLTRKIQAAYAYGKELMPPPHSRSENYIRSLAVVRGAMSGCDAAEGFVQIRSRYRA